jgi:hypothetical protein
MLAVTIVGALVASVTASSPARGDERTEAKSHFKAGMELIAAHDYRRGIDELQTAYMTLPHPNVLFDIARAYSEEGALRAAIDFYEQYVAFDPADADAVRATIRHIGEAWRRLKEAMISGAPIAKAFVTSAPRGAKVQFDGANGDVACDSTPCTIYLLGAQTQRPVALYFTRHGYRSATINVSPSSNASAQLAPEIAAAPASNDNADREAY